MLLLGLICAASEGNKPWPKTDISDATLVSEVSLQEEQHGHTHDTPSLTVLRKCSLQIRSLAGYYMCFNIGIHRKVIHTRTKYKYMLLFTSYTDRTHK